jgi:hypothetical protein
MARFRNRAFNLGHPKDQKRITIARCWAHSILTSTDPTQPGQDQYSNCFAWGDQNIYREKEIDIVVRFCYAGPGVQGGATENDYVHHKTSLYIYAFCRWDVPSNHNLISQRFGRKSTWVGNYGPVGLLRLWDDMHWVFGNVWSRCQCPCGISPYYDETKNLITVGPNYPGGPPGTNQGGFPPTTRLRMAGNQIANGTVLGVDLSSNSFSTRQDGPLPDPIPAGVAKPQRILEDPPGTFTTYAAMPAGDGLSIRAHTGSVTIADGMTHANLQPQAVNVSHLPNDAAATVWRTDLFARYPWIEALCPNPTSQTGGIDGSAPWQLALDLQRGDVATPTVNTTGYRRTTGGGLMP